MNLEAVKLAIDGNTNELGNLITENMQSMYRVAFSILKSEEEIADAVSSTIVIVFEKINTLREAQFFKTWMTRILINECYKIVKKNKKIVYLENYNENEISYTDTYTDYETRELVKNLDKDLKEIVVLYYFEDYSVKDISKIVKIPEGTVKSRLSRARKELEKKLLPIIERGELNG